MNEIRRNAVIAIGIATFAFACGPSVRTFGWTSGNGTKTLRVVNREATQIAERNGVRLSPASGNGVAWLDGSDFRFGSIELDVRGRESMGQSFVGVAFHRQDDDNYEAVYVRPFNFRVDDSLRRQHAVQYIKWPEFDWEPLRTQFPGEFENPVAASVDPDDWLRLRVIVEGSRIHIYVGSAGMPALEVRKLGGLQGGQIGLWVGNLSGGDFANIAVTPTN